MSNTIKEQLSAAIGARKDSLKALRARITDLLEDVPVGVKLADENGEVVRIVKMIDCGIPDGCGRRHYKTWAAVTAGLQIICVDNDDDDAMYYVPGDDMLEDEIKRANGALTREIAARLPEAVARYIAECEAERAANESTAVAQ